MIHIVLLIMAIITGVIWMGSVTTDVTTREQLGRVCVHTGGAWEGKRLNEECRYP